jgi:hypothetical protein
MLDDIDINKELIEDESPAITVESRNNTSIDEAPNGWPIRRTGSTSTATSNVPEQFRRTSRAISDGLTDIAAGRSNGKYPAIDAIIGKQWPASHTICTPDCPNRNRSKQNIDESFTSTPSFGSLANIPTNERLAVLDHRVGDLEKNMDRVTELAVRTNESSCSKDDLRDRIASIHKRLDRDMLPAIANLQKRRTFRDRVYPVWLTVSLIGNILTVYIILK